MPDRSPRTRLVVIFGGVSAEHDVSCESARHVVEAIDRTRYEALPVGITTDGRWVLSESAAAALAAAESGPLALPKSLDPSGPPLEPLPTVSPTAPGEQVVVFPLVHGPLGEDGTLQGMLELAGVPYVGSGVLGSALCMDKAVAKEVAARAGLPQARWLAARDVEVDGRFRDRVVSELGLPVFVKPANLGSSVGITKAHDPDALDEALRLACAYDEFVVVEEAVRAREIEVAVLGNAEPRASVPGEVRPSHEFYDYDDKYLAGAADLLVPAPLDEGATAEVRALAVRAFTALRCDGFARVDFLYEEGGRGFLLNEVNTIPGFTPISMVPALWEATGVPYGELVDELVRLGVERYRHRAGFGRKR
ncbi:MAG: D-alanine--D-alanine ligase [Actinobacteria bacterium]|nr:D-alanine--D-alanine ligase [Actinomycetota bacterium]